MYIRGNSYVTVFVVNEQTYFIQRGSQLMIRKLLEQENITVAGHRGFKTNYPENTILSFVEALKLGVDMLEIDLNLTRDKEIVLIHDLTVDRTTDGSGLVRDYSLEEIKKLDAGAWFGEEFKNLRVPTLQELVDVLKDYPEILLNVEIKDRTHEMVDATMELLERENLVSRCVFTCFDAEIVGYMYDKYQAKTQGFPDFKMDNFVEGEAGTYSKMWAVGIEMGVLTPELVQEFKDRGILAWSYCPDTDEQVEKSIECGVSLMTCNNPEPALRIAQARGLR